MDLLQLFVALCVLLGVNAFTTLPPNPTTPPIVEDEVPSSKPPEHEHNMSRCHSNEEERSGRFAVQRGFRGWFEALGACERRGLQLAVPRSPQEAVALGALLLADAQPAPAGAMPDALFVGVHNMGGGALWSTIDGRLLSEAGYDLWVGGGDGACGALLGDGRYVPQPCGARLRFACEAPVAAASVEGAGYVEVGGARVRLAEEPLPWAAARLRCEAEGAALAVPASAREAGLLAGVFFTRAHSNARLQRHGFFVGVSDVAEEGVWRTVAGQSLAATEESPWKAGEPSGGRSENCAALQSDGRYADQPCSGPLPYCCQEARAPAAPEERVVTRGRFRLHRQPLEWLAAVRSCQRESATLASAAAQDRDSLLALMRGSQQDLYGNPEIDEPWIHVAIYDSFGNQTWSDINEEESPTPRQNMNSMRRRPHRQMRYNGYERSDEIEYNDYDSAPNTEMFSVGYAYNGGKCVKMDYLGKFNNEICSDLLPYVCKRLLSNY